MASIIQAQCENCDYKTPRTSAERVAVLLEEASDSPFALDDDRRIVVIPHPCGSGVMHGLGYTSATATLSGRLLTIRTLVCQTCGHLFDARRLTASGAIGCMPAMLVGSVAGWIVGVWQSSFWLGLFAFWSSMLATATVTDWSAKRFVRWRFSERAREVDTPRICPQCGSHDVADAISSKHLPCPGCGQRTMRVRMVGKS